MKKVLTLIILVSIVSFSGCVNMPTKTSQITGAYVSPVKYKSYTDAELISELNSLNRREKQLSIAQEQRYKTSEVQAFWFGYGQGDGVEAAELAQVRGEREAVLKVVEERGLTVPIE